MNKLTSGLLGVFVVCLAGLYGQTYLQGDISHMTLTPDVEWIVTDTVFVPDGDTLIIEPGTVIKFTPGVEAWLMVKRGGYIHAAGTEADPITFTSAAENPQAGDWLAPMFYGKGPGQTPDWTVDPTHNLGVLQYIKLEYTQWSFGLYNVGTGTTVDHISTYNGGGFYIRGGNVNLNYLAVNQAASAGMYFRGGYSGQVSEVFINGARSRGIDISNTHGEDAWTAAQLDPDLEPRTNPTLQNVTICNSLSATVRFRYGAVGNINNILLYNHAYRWGSSIRCYNDYLLDQISIDSLQTWHSWAGLYDGNADLVINHDHVFEEDPVFSGFTPTAPQGIGAMINGDWLSAWGHAIDIDKIVFAGFDDIDGFGWGAYLGAWEPLVIPGSMLTLRAWYYADFDFGVSSADLKILFDSQAYSVVDVYPDENYLPAGEALVEYNVQEDTITVSFASSASYAGVMYLFNVDLLASELVGPLVTFIEVFDAAVNEDSEMHFIYDNWRFLIPDNIFGDVSMNGEISSMDASLVLQSLVGNIWLGDVQEHFGDVSGDEGLTAYDASLIQQYMVGAITEFPVISGAEATPATGLISLEDGELRPGETLEIPLHLSQGDNILSFEADIMINQDHLSLEEVQLSSALADFIIEINADNEMVRIAGAGALPDGATGVFANVVFNVNSEMSADQTEISISRLRWNEGPPQFDVASATITNIVGINEGNALPAKVHLKQNFPNPFNPVTSIEYGLPEQSEVSIIIYDITGGIVRTLVDGSQAAAWYQLQWNGLSEAGQPVNAGLYFCRLQVGNVQQTIKMINLK